MRNHLLHLSAILVLVSPCWCQFLLGGQDYGATIPHIMDVLRRRHLSGSLEYSGSCTDQFHSPDFLKENAASNEAELSLQALREMFANDKDMQVTQEPDGIIRMVEKSVPQELLNVKIRHISFDEENKKLPMFFPINVLWAITHSPEVVTFMKDSDIRLVPTMMNEASSPVIALNRDFLTANEREIWPASRKTYWAPPLVRIADNHQPTAILTASDCLRFGTSRGKMRAV
jgi:hypothetical protein